MVLLLLSALVSPVLTFLQSPFCPWEWLRRRDCIFGIRRTGMSLSAYASPDRKKDGPPTMNYKQLLQFQTVRSMIRNLVLCTFVFVLISIAQVNSVNSDDEIVTVPSGRRRRAGTTTVPDGTITRSSHSHHSSPFGSSAAKSGPHRFGPFAVKERYRGQYGGYMRGDPFVADWTERSARSAMPRKRSQRKK